MAYVPANFRDADLMRVLHALEKAGHKVRKIRVTREAAEVFIVDDTPVAVETRITTEAEASAMPSQEIKPRFISCKPDPGGFYDEHGRPLPLG